MTNHEQKIPVSSSVGKIWVEVCLISARGLPRSSLFKHQWYAVGWIDPKNKYCTTIDASGTANPQWKTKFATSIDYGFESEFQDSSLHLEVYSREPLFLREKLQGTASVSLREFLAKSEEGNGDVGSFQLRKIKSDKPLGFIDVSIRVSQEKEISSSYSYLGKEEGFNLDDGRNGINLQGYPGKPRPPQPVNHPYTGPPPVYSPNYPNPSLSGPGYPQTLGGPSYPPRTPAPPTNVGYIPSFNPQTNSQPTTYMNMPSSGRGVGPGFGVGLGAGALAAGAVIFGDDFRSGFQLPAAISHAGSSFSISTDLPF